MTQCKLLVRTRRSIVVEGIESNPKLLDNLPLSDDMIECRWRGVRDFWLFVHFNILRVEGPW